jgi:UDP-glucuronate 4-epimerase
MAPMLFSRAIRSGEPIAVHDGGRMMRDFTYIDDVVESVLRVAGRPPAPDPGWSPDGPDPSRSDAPFRLYNVGNHSPVELERFIALLEKAWGRKAVRKDIPAPASDVRATFAETADLEREFGFRPSTPLESGLAQLVAWYRQFYDSLEGSPK